MSLIQWKQLDTLLIDTVYTGSFDVSGSIVLNGVPLSTTDTIFTQTGSFWNTTRNIGITGSFVIDLDGITDRVSISVQGQEKVSVNTEGVVKLAAQTQTPTAVEGGIFYSASDSFFLGFNN